MSDCELDEWLEHQQWGLCDDRSSALSVRQLMYEMGINQFDARRLVNRRRELIERQQPESQDVVATVPIEPSFKQARTKIDRQQKPKIKPLRGVAKPKVRLSPKAVARVTRTSQSRRRELFTPFSCIYAVVDETHGLMWPHSECYVGQSRDRRDRWDGYLKYGAHSERLQQLLDLGVTNLSFRVLEECPIGHLDDRENWWILHVCPAYNTAWPESLRVWSDYPQSIMGQCV